MDHKVDHHLIDHFYYFLIEKIGKFLVIFFEISRENFLFLLRSILAYFLFYLVFNFIFLLFFYLIIYFNYLF